MPPTGPTNPQALALLVALGLLLALAVGGCTLYYLAFGHN